MLGHVISGLEKFGQVMTGYVKLVLVSC